MICPDCGGNLFRIRLVFSGSVSCAVDEDGGIDVLEPVRLGSHMPDDAPCRCSRCRWVGTVVETRPDGEPPAAEELDEESLRELASLLASGELTPTSAAALERLLEEYQALRSRDAAIADSWIDEGD